MESPRWNIITPSQYEWERRGLDFIRTGLPDHDPYRAWANFEFQTDDGAIYEVDLLVLTKQGFWLVECKAWGGRIWGDTGTWTRSQDGKIRSEDNPVLLANRKAKALSSLLKAQPAVSKVRLPWLDALVFLSTDDVQCDLTGNARNRVLLKDRSKTETRPEQKGILAALINREGPGIDPDPRAVIDIRVAKALSRAMEQVGIRPSQRSRRVGDYILGDLIFDGPGYQDRLAKHASFDNVFCLVRQYTVAQAASEEDRQRLQAGGGSGVPDHPDSGPPEHSAGSGLQGARAWSGPVVPLPRPRCGSVRSLARHAQPQARHRPATRTLAANRRRHSIRPSQAGDPSFAGSAEHPRFRDLVITAPASGLQLAGGHSRIRVHIGASHQRRRFGRGTIARLHVARKLCPIPAR